MTLTNDLVSKVLALPVEERAELASRLIASLDPELPDADAEETWTAEIDRRLSSIDESKLVDWQDAVAEAREALRKTDRK
jgi:putative addiction module component (TIGR02574 family)